jgi:hypothetical protein
MTRVRRHILKLLKSVPNRIAILLPVLLALGMIQSEVAWAKPPISRYIDYPTFEYLVKKCTGALKDVNQVIGKDPNLFFGGGGLRGVIAYIYRSVEQGFPSSSLCNQYIGTVENFTQYGADKDLYVRPGYHHIGKKGGWDILSAEFAAASRQAGGAAIEKVQVRPNELVDPFGALRAYYQGELKYIDIPESQFAKFRSSTGDAGLASNRKTALLLRWLRFASELPGVTLTGEQLKMANDVLTDEILHGQIEPGNYWVAKALKKNFWSHGVHHFDNWKEFFTGIPVGCYLGDLEYFVVNGHANVPLSQIFSAEECAEAKVKLHTEALRRGIPAYQIANHQLPINLSVMRSVSDETARNYLKEVARAALLLTDHPNPGMLPGATYTSHPLTAALINSISSRETPENLAVLKELKPVYQRILKNASPGTEEALDFDVLRALDLIDEKTLEKWTSEPHFILFVKAEEKLELLHKKNPEKARAAIRRVIDANFTDDSVWNTFLSILSKPQSELAKDLGAEINRNFGVFLKRVVPERNRGKGTLNLLASAKDMISEENQKQFAARAAKLAESTSLSGNNEVMDQMLRMVMDQPQTFEFLPAEDLKRLIYNRFKIDAALNDLKRFASPGQRPPTITSLYKLDPVFVGFLKQGATRSPQLDPYFARSREELYRAVTEFMHSPHVASEEAWSLLQTCKVLNLFRGANHDLLKEYASRFGTLKDFTHMRSFFDWNVREMYPSAADYVRANLAANPEFFKGSVEDAKAPFQDLKTLLSFWGLEDEFDIIAKGHGKNRTITVLPKEDSWKRTLFKAICKPAEKKLNHSK